MIVFKCLSEVFKALLHYIKLTTRWKHWAASAAVEVNAQSRIHPSKLKISCLCLDPHHHTFLYLKSYFVGIWGPRWTTSLEGDHSPPSAAAGLGVMRRSWTVVLIVRVPARPSSIWIVNVTNQRMAQNHCCSLNKTISRSQWEGWTQDSRASSRVQTGRPLFLTLIWPLFFKRHYCQTIIADGSKNERLLM